MSKFSRYLALPCVIIFIALYLIGLNIINRIDRVDNLKSAVSFSEEAEENAVLPASEKVNINSADKDELMTIEGVGEETAEDIIKTREEIGGFKTIEDIKKVYGIGDKKFENMRESITVE